jgi:hypothetical protein
MTDAGSDRLFNQAFIALTVSKLAYFTAGGLVIGVTPFFVTAHSARTRRRWGSWPARSAWPSSPWSKAMPGC